MREIIEIDGEKRFKQNRIINVLLDMGKLTIENIWCFYEYGMFELEDLKEFFQLIGFSVKEYNEIKQFEKVQEPEWEHVKTYYEKDLRVKKEDKEVEAKNE